MAITFLNAGAPRFAGSGGLSVSITVPTGTDILWVNAFGGPTTAPSVCTLGGVSLTLVDTQSSSGAQCTGLWYMVSPPSGAQTLVVSGGSSTNGATWSAYSGAKQTGVPDSHNKLGVTAATITVSTTVVLPNSWLVMATSDNTGTITGGTGTTVRAEDSSRGGGIVDSNGSVGSGSQSLIVNSSGASAMTGVIASFAPVASATVKSGFFFSALR